jgi:replicative DNA helicase
MDHSLALELRILSVIRNKKSYYKYNTFLKQEFFQSEPTRQLFSLIEEYYEESKKTEDKLSRSDLKVIVHKNIRNEDLKKDTLRAIKKMSKLRVKDNIIFEEAIKDFAKRNLVKKAILSGLEILESPKADFTEIQEHLDKAINISVNIDEGCCQYFEAPENRLRLDTRESVISSGIPSLDGALGGGFGPGELIVILAPPERGKTLTLINFAAAALYQGKKVGYLTLEISARKVARRFDLRISGRTFEGLKKEPSRIKTPLAFLRKTGCDLIIKDYSAEDPTIQDLKSFIINYQNRSKGNFDILCVDYADLIKPSKTFKTERFGIKEVYTNLRRLANEFHLPIVTASQANRKAMDKKILSMEDFAEDFGKAAVADVVISICQSPEELEDELCRLYLAKNRTTGKHLYFRVNMRPTLMYVGEGNNRTKSKTKERRDTVADKISRGGNHG